MNTKNYTIKISDGLSKIQYSDAKLISIYVSFLILNELCKSRVTKIDTLDSAF